MANLDEAAQNTKAWIVLLWQSEQASQVCLSFVMSCLSEDLSQGLLVEKIHFVKGAGFTRNFLHPVTVYHLHNKTCHTE